MGTRSMIPAGLRHIPAITAAKAVLASGALMLALIRFFAPGFAGERMDKTFLTLLGAAVLILLVPWERLTILKAGGIELALDRPHVRGAVEALGLDRIEDKQLRDALEARTERLELVRGARVLWIDDKPHDLVALRRLLRALGVNVVAALSSAAASAVLERDNDFDLVISDVQRGVPERTAAGVEHEGAQYALELRRNRDPVIRSLPIIFYTAWPNVEVATRLVEPVMTTSPRPIVSISADTFIPAVVDELAAARNDPITVSAEAKKPTGY